jgi:hypothetical protein
MHEALARAAELAGQTTTEVLLDALSAELNRRGVWPPGPRLTIAPALVPLFPGSIAPFDDAYRELDELLVVAEQSPPSLSAAIEEVEHAFDRAGDREREEATSPERAAEMTARMDAAHVRLSNLRNALKASRRT